MASLIPLFGTEDATKPWKSFKGIQPAEHLHIDVTSSDRLKLICLWLRVCDKRHEGPCGIKYDHPLPTRVLDVGVLGQSHDIHLFESKGKVGRYIALSHCWGEAAIIKTLSTTLETFKSGMPVQSLPKTFQDAILLTRHLVGPYQSYKVKYCVPSEDGNYIEVFVRQRLRQLCGLEWFVGKRINVKTDRPLETRAWTYQEDILPRRILKLYSDEILFECEQQTVRESLIEQTKNSRELRMAGCNATPEAISDRWRSHVTQYSGRSLTYVKDRFPALSGIAHEFHKLNQSTYCAGLWKHSIQEDPQWHTETETPLTRLESTEGNALPTWSWAPTNGRVSWFTRGGGLNMYNVYNEAHIPPWGFSVNPAGNDPFGALSGAVLIAVGFTLTATIRYETPYKASATRGKGSAYVWPDYDYTLSGKSHIPDGSEVVLFLMSTKIIRTISYEHSMLALRRIAVSEADEEIIAKEDGQWALYERIGYANCDSDDADIDFGVCKKRDLVMLY